MGQVKVEKRSDAMLSKMLLDVDRLINIARADLGSSLKTNKRRLADRAADRLLSLAKARGHLKKSKLLNR